MIIVEIEDVFEIETLAWIVVVVKSASGDVQEGMILKCGDEFSKIKKIEYTYKKFNDYLTVILDSSPSLLKNLNMAMRNSENVLIDNCNIER